MKAVILAAGQGLRLRPLTDDYPKCMVEYKGKQIVDYILEAMREAGIKDVILVKGYKAEVLNKAGTVSVINPRYDQTNMVASLFCSEHLWDDDLLISYADIVYPASILNALIAEQHPFAVAVDKDWEKLWRKRMNDPLKSAETLKLSPDGFIRELGKKPRGYEDIQGQYMGLIKIKKEILPQIKEFYHSLDRAATYDGKNFDNMFMTSFIQLLIDRILKVKPVFVRGGWLEIDSIEDLKISLDRKLF